MSFSQPKTVDLVKTQVLYFWIANNDNNSDFCYTKECETLKDLKATLGDCKNILKFARKLYVPRENIIREVNPTVKELNGSFESFKD